jgi:hypothetical protein
MSFDVQLVSRLRDRGQKWWKHALATTVVNGAAYGHACGLAQERCGCGNHPL